MPKQRRHCLCFLVVHHEIPSFLHTCHSWSCYQWVEDKENPTRRSELDQYLETTFNTELPQRTWIVQFLGCAQAQYSQSLTSPIARGDKEGLSAKLLEYITVQRSVVGRVQSSEIHLCRGEVVSCYRLFRGSGISIAEGIQNAPGHSLNNLQEWFWAGAWAGELQRSLPIPVSLCLS